MIRYGILILAFASVFFFPYPITALCTILAAFAMPFAGLALGIFTDALYFNSHASSLPLASIIGVLATLGAVLGSRFVRTHLIQVSP